MSWLDLSAATEHVANAIFDVLIPALLLWIANYVRQEWERYRDRRDR